MYLSHASQFSHSRLPCELLVHTSRSLTAVLLSYLIYVCSDVNLLSYLLLTWLRL